MKIRVHGIDLELEEWKRVQYSLETPDYIKADDKKREEILKNRLKSLKIKF